jgi:hypothetical protein
VLLVVLLLSSGAPSGDHVAVEMLLLLHNGVSYDLLHREVSSCKVLSRSHPIFVQLRCVCGATNQEIWLLQQMIKFLRWFIFLWRQRPA